MIKITNSKKSELKKNQPEVSPEEAASLQDTYSMLSGGLTVGFVMFVLSLLTCAKVPLFPPGDDFPVPTMILCLFLGMFGGSVARRLLTLLCPQCRIIVSFEVIE